MDWSLCQQALLLSSAPLTGLGVLASSFCPELAGFLGLLGFTLLSVFQKCDLQRAPPRVQEEACLGRARAGLALPRSSAGLRNTLRTPTICFKVRDDKVGAHRTFEASGKLQRVKPKPVSTASSPAPFSFLGLHVIAL